MHQIDLHQAKLLWVFGALERLATLGFILEPPYKVSQDTIDLFLELDEDRNTLFPEDVELKDILKYILTEVNGNVDVDTLDGFYTLLIDYKNNRDRIVKYSLEKAFSGS